MTFFSLIKSLLDSTYTDITYISGMGEYFINCIGSPLCRLYLFAYFLISALSRCHGTDQIQAFANLFYRYTKSRPCKDRSDSRCVFFVKHKPLFILGMVISKRCCTHRHGIFFVLYDLSGSTDFLGYILSVHGIYHVLDRHSKTAPIFFSEAVKIVRHGYEAYIQMRKQGFNVIAGFQIVTPKTG